MIKDISKRFLSLTLAFLLVAALLPGVVFTAYAAELIGLPVEGLGASYDGGTWSAVGDSITGSVTGEKGACSSSSGTSVLTLTNSKDTAATLSFDYEIVKNDNSGTIQIDGEKITGPGSFSKELQPGDTIKINLESAKGDYTTALKLSGIRLIVDREVTTTFVPAENGSFTVDDVLVKEQTVIKRQSTVPYELSATPFEGFSFIGWYSETNQKYLSTQASTTLYLDADRTITAKFVPDSLPVFETAGNRFTDLSEAVTYAQENGGSIITLVQDGPLDGDYTIPSGITLLIPFDEAGTCYTTEPANTDSAYIKPKVFRTLTMAEGSSLTVEGSISVSAKHTAGPSNAQNGAAPTAAYGQISMMDGSSITVKDGGALYAWGYITGNGRVTAESGASVYEYFQIADFRGGNATLGMMGESVFPFSQYYVQNVEVPLTIMGGANEYVYTSLYASGMATSTSICFIGSDGMFQLSEGSSFTKTYDPATDRMAFDINGDAALNSLSLSLMGMTMDSSKYVLPINSNITLNIHSGTTTINQDVALQPGVQASIDRGACLKVAEGKNVYVYDADEWGNFVNESYRFRAVIYTPTRRYTRTNADMKDVTVDINGTVDAAGSLYTTAGGAHIISSQGTGRYILTGGAGMAENTKQVTQSGTSVTYVEIPITSAKLCNADGFYTETAGAAAGDTYVYSSGKWQNKADLNGWVTDENGTTYLENGEKVYFDKWQEIDGATFYFKTDGYIAKGLYEITSQDGSDTTTFIFDPETGVFLKDQNELYDVGPDTYWTKDGTVVEYPGLIRVVKDDGEINYYYFGKDNKAFKAKGENNLCLLEKTNGLRLPANQNFPFDENGVILHDSDTSKDGWVTEDDGKTYNYVDGITVYLGLIEKDGDYYYIRYTGEVVMGCAHWVERTNGLLPKGTYTFDEDGKMVRPGIVEEDDSLWYYENGKRTYAGLIQIDGDYYYVRSSGEVVHGEKYWITKTNGLLPEGNYTFGDDGKMTDSGASKLNGIVAESGSLYYYVDGKRTYAGLIEIDGSYYYVRSTGEVVHDRTYWITKTNGLLPEGNYNFDQDGKMVP